MANYTAADIKALRERTGAGMMDVKKALDEADGDMDKAIEAIRIKGLKALPSAKAALLQRVSYWPRSSTEPPATCSRSMLRRTSLRSPISSSAWLRRFSTSPSCVPAGQR